MGVSFSLARPKAKSSSIRVKISTQGANFFVYTGKTISPELWDFKKAFIKSQVGNPTAAKASKYLRKIQMDLTDLFDDYRFGISNMTFLELQIKTHEIVGNLKSKLIIQNRALAMPSKSLVDFISLFICDSESGKRLSKHRLLIKETTIKSYRTTRTYISQFQMDKKKSLLLSEIKQSDIDEISDYIINDRNHSLNTHAKFMGDLKQIFKYAELNKLITQSQYLGLKFDTITEETDSIYLNQKEILEMYQLTNLPSKNHEIVRDIFVAACYMGLRYGDYSTLDLSTIKNNRIELIARKTSSKIIIPLHPIVNTIFEKYNFELPPIPKNNEFNRLIKQVGALMPSLQSDFTKLITYRREKIMLKKPKYMFLQSHCPRRSFATNELMRNTKITDIMKITGHKMIKNFQRYIKSSGEEAAAALEKSWNEEFNGIN